MAGMAVPCEADCTMYEKTFNFRRKHRKYGKVGLKNVFFPNFRLKPEKTAFYRFFPSILKNRLFTTTSCWRQLIRTGKLDCLLTFESFDFESGVSCSN